MQDDKQTLNFNKYLNYPATNHQNNSYPTQYANYHRRKNCTELYQLDIFDHLQLINFHLPQYQDNDSIQQKAYMLGTSHLQQYR